MSKWSIPISTVIILVLSFLPFTAKSNCFPEDQLPKIWQILWSNKFTPDELSNLKSMGVDGVFKCVSYEPDSPDDPVLAGGEWRLVERVEGDYDWSSLQTCLDNALAADMWFIPEVVINIPPEWFVSRYPDSLLRDYRDITATDPNDSGAPYLLSPWFIANGEADSYLEPFISSFIALVSQYPNVPAVMIGNFKLNVLPWKMGSDDNDDFDYWPIFDSYALSSYADEFGVGESPPETMEDYLAMGDVEKSAFENWLIEAMCDNLETRYLDWLSGFTGWKVINVSIWDNDGVKESIFTTQTPSMISIKQAAILASGVHNVIINDDNMGDCWLAARQQDDIYLANENGFLIYGERVLPEVCTWEQMYDMWAAFNPLPDGLINIGNGDAYWMGEFRSLYGPISNPLTKTYLPLVLN